MFPLIYRGSQSFRVEAVRRFSSGLPGSGRAFGLLLPRGRRAALAGAGGPGVWITSRSSRTRTTRMPKKEKTLRRAAAGGAGAAQTEASGPVSRDKGGCVTVTVRAKPGSKHSAITDVSAEAVGVAVAAPPADGEANAELVRYLAEVLDLKKSHICVDKGSRSRDKVIRVDSSLSPEEVLRRFRQAERTGSGSSRTSTATKTQREGNGHVGKDQSFRCFRNKE